MSPLVSRDIVLKNIPQDTTIDPTHITTSLTWQSPTYLLQKEDTLLSEYTCDADHEECKINLLVIPLLDGTESTQLICEIVSDFELVPTSDPCNPNTSLVPSGDHVITVRILQKVDMMPLITREILIKNPLRTSGG